MDKRAATNSEIVFSKFVSKTLNKLYPNPEVPLNHSSDYTLLISVLLSAQCTDVRVNKITPSLFMLADTPIKMSKLNVKVIEKIIRPCGLAPRKAKAISELSKILVEKFNSVVPDNENDLESLPGVGHKTASVVMAQAFNIPSFPVDTHIHRLAQRWGFSSGKNVGQTERDLKEIFPKKLWNKLHLQIIYYGREYCPARGHKVEDCIICRELQRHAQKPKNLPKN